MEIIRIDLKKFNLFEDWLMLNWNAKKKKNYVADLDVIGTKL